MMLAATSAVLRKDLVDAVRNPPFLSLSVFVPLVFVGIFTLVIHTSATNPVAVAADGDGPHTERFVETLREMHTADGPYFDLITTDPDEAGAAYQRGDVPGVIHLPPNFDAAVDSQASAPVLLQVYNIDSDGTKNLELRLSHAVHLFNSHHLEGEGLVVEESSVFPTDIPMRRYFGTALLMFSIIFLAMMNTGTLVANEWEQRTAKAVVLSPVGFMPLLVGKWLGAAVLTLGGLAVVAAVVTAMLDLPLTRIGIPGVLVFALLFAYGASLGALLGVKLKNSLLLVPASAVISIMHLLLAGFESYIRGFAHGGPLLALWRVGAIWPVSSLTDAVRFQIEGIADGANAAGPAAAMVAITVLLTAIAVRHLRSQLTFSQGM